MRLEIKIVIVSVRVKNVDAKSVQPAFVQSGLQD